MTSVSESITKTLGTGSGIDLKALVTNLVDAQYAAKNAELTSKETKLTAQISGVAKLKSAVTDFDTVLKSLAKGGTLATQPASSNTAIVTASLVTGGKAPAASTSLTVKTIATAQAATSATIPAADTFAAGTLSVTIGSGAAIPITIEAGSTLATIATQIQTATGLATSLVTDGTGSRMTVKGSTGAAQAFTITAANDDGTTTGNLARLATVASDGSATQSGLVIGSTAQDAELVIDGATYKRATNSISDLIPGVKLDLTTAAPGTPVTITAKAPIGALSQMVTDFVAFYNEMRTTLNEQTNATSGVLTRDSTATGIGRSLAQLTTTKLATATTTGGPQTLADLGVATNRDGTLTVDATRLAAVLAGNPADVEAIFANGTGASGGGLSAAFSTIATRLTDKTYGLDGATTRYTAAQKLLTTARTKATDDATAMNTRLTRQFASMDSRVAAYKSIQTFLTGQIAAWNKSDS